MYLQMSSIELKSYIVHTVCDNFSDPSFNVQRLSYRLRISNSYLRELTFKYFNTTPQKFIETRRLELSLKLISEGININNVATKCGYTSIHPFNLAFKRRIGKNPSTMKKIIKKYPSKTKIIVEIFRKKLLNE